MPKNGQNWESSQRPNNASADFPGPAALASVTQVRGSQGLRDWFIGISRLAFVDARPLFKALSKRQ